jgi:outer membrane lipase/esterase
MRQTNFALALLTAAVLSACGGSDNDSANTPPAVKPQFLAQVNFGDSLSDVGTYKVGSVAALGGGKYTINGDLTAKNPALTGKVWPELIAAQLGLPAPCAAQTGLEGSGNGFMVPVVNYPLCNNYAQGGSRVTDPIGPGNKAVTPTVGQLTKPIAEQIARHLTKVGGKFTGSEVVFVMAGGNDALQLLSNLNTAATAAGGQAYAKTLIGALAAGTSNPATAAPIITTTFGTEIATSGNLTTATTKAIGAAFQLGYTAIIQPAVNTPIVDKAKADAAAAGAAYGAANGPAQATAMSLAGAQEAALIREQLVAKGARYVVVNNLPDLGGTPFGKALGVSSPSSLTLVNGMVSAFNTALRAGIDGLEQNVVYVDLYTASVDQVAHPENYGITNATTPACLTTNALGGTSLVCNGSNILGVDVSHYLFADGVHPTPFGSSLIAKATVEAMVKRGWL